MANNPPYIIVAVKNNDNFESALHALSKEVSIMIAGGYIPQGGVSICAFSCAQAMILTSHKDFQNKE